jgi:hypothetical protein
MHFIDYLVHGWDVVKAISADRSLDPELCVTILRMGEGWTSGSLAIWGPGVPFGYRVRYPTVRLLIVECSVFSAASRTGRMPEFPSPVRSIYFQPVAHYRLPGEVSGMKLARGLVYPPDIHLSPYLEVSMRDTGLGSENLFTKEFSRELSR